MKLTVVNSNSLGNCYLFESSNGETLILELGVNFNTVKRYLNFNLRKVVGALVTHSHLDHCRSVRDAVKAGINVYGPREEFLAMGLNDFIYEKGDDFHVHHRLGFIPMDKDFNIGSYKIRAFKIEHDTPSPVGYLIFHAEAGNILFLTDTYYCKYKFPGLNNILIECNHSREILKQKMNNGTLPKFLSDRVMKSHMNLETCKDLLSCNDISGVKNIVLIHLSDANSDSEHFKSQIEAITGKMVHIAEAGLVLDNFDLSQPF